MSPTRPDDFVFFVLPLLSLSLSLSVTEPEPDPDPDCLRVFLSSFFTPAPVPAAASLRPEKILSDFGFSLSSKQLLGCVRKLLKILERDPDSKDADPDRAEAALVQTGRGIEEEGTE